jgi:hypothetical protein
MHEQNLMQKSVAALSFYARKRRTTSQMGRVARSFAQRELLRRAFGRMFVGMCVVRDTMSKRSFLKRAIAKWANEITVKTVFGQFKLAVNLQKQEML